MIPDTGTCHVILNTRYLTLVLAMLYLTHDTWHRYFSCYIWHMIPDTGTWHAILATWYVTPVFAMLYLTLIYDTSTWHMLSLGPSIHWPDIVTLDRTLPPLIPVLYGTWYCGTCIILHIHDYYFTGTWLLYCYQIFGTPVLLNSCTPELLYSWTLKKGSWYYTPVNSHSWIIMVVLYTLMDIIFGQYI